MADSPGVRARWLGLIYLMTWLGCGWPALPGSPRHGPPGHDPPASVPGVATSLMVLPDDGSDGVLAALAGARRRAWVEMYLLTDGDAVDALVAAHRAGADVRVLLEPAPYGGGDNQSAYLALQQAGVDVRWFAVPGGLVHIKLLLIDEAAWVLTPNLTSAGLTRNREYVAVDLDAGDVARAEAVFTADAAGRPLAEDPSSRIVVSPLDARPRLAAAIDAARTTLLLEIEEISDADLLARLGVAHGRGVAVSVLVPAADRSAATSAAVATLQADGIPVRALPSPTLHAKAMVMDATMAYVGSVNFTRASLDDNRELGLLLDDRGDVSRVASTITGDWNGATAP